MLLFRSENKNRVLRLKDVGVPSIKYGENTALLIIVSLSVASESFPSRGNYNKMHLHNSYISQM